MKSPARTRRLVVIGLIIGAALAIGGIAVVPLKEICEFSRAESVKGYWATLQGFVKENGRYPKDNAEIDAFFHTTSEEDPVEYVAPRDDGADEVVLWWKQKTIFGVRVGVTESGWIVKE